MIDVNGQLITASALGGLAFNASGFCAPVTKQPGFVGWKAYAGSDTNQYSPPNAPWPINTFTGNSGHISGGVFTCPVAGIYLCSAAGIMNGYGATQTHGYAGFSKNNINTVFTHWNMGQTNAWVQGGTAQLFSCAAGDTLRFHINNPPLANVNASSGVYGWYADGHHAIWITRIS